MKLHRLDLEGFGPYRERQSVDFDAFADDGIFLIAGRTGAGKSSILDGVCFALYGSAPRYDGAEKRLRSDHSAPDDVTEVVLEFTVAGARWRATRAPEYTRPKRRGDGVTTEPARAQLDELIDSRWEGRAVGPRNVALALDEILGLTQQQFLQVILLAQNQFQRFLLARNDERQALLRTLFGTRTYDEYGQTLEQRRKVAAADVAAGTARIAVHLADAEDAITENEVDGDHAGVCTAPDDTAAQVTAPAAGYDERIDRAERAALRLTYREGIARTAQDAAELAHRAAVAAHAEAQALQVKQRQRHRSRVALDELIADAPAVAAAREALERAVRAEALRALTEACERAERATATAAAAEVQARAAWVAAGEEARDDIELAAAHTRIGDELAVARGAVGREAALERAAADAEAATDRAVALQRTRVDLDERCAVIPAQRDGLDAERAEAAVVAGGLDAARAELHRLDAQRTAAQHAEVLVLAVRGADEAHVRCSGALQDAVAAVTALLRRRLSGYAGELAATLDVGEPCVVCGSTAHPQPAVRADDPVTDFAIESAESLRDAATVAEREASTAARLARAAHADAAVAAGGASVPSLDAAVHAAHTRVAAAEHAVRRRDELVSQGEELRLAQTAAEAERITLGAQIETTAANLATITTTAAALRRDVVAARGAYATVVERVDALGRRYDCGTAALTSIRDHRTRTDAAREVTADLDARVVDSVFADAAEATAALLDDAARADLDNRVRVHESALHAERERLRGLELELAGSDQIADTDASALALARAREEWDGAVAAAAGISAAAARLRRGVDQAAAARAEIAQRADEHDAIARLADTVAGRAPNTHRMTLETFVLAAELEQIVAAANRRLDEMSSGRYALAHTDARAARNGASGLGIEVRDAYTGQARPAQSLSGGETFLASLALALGLAEVVTNRAGGLRLDTLFIDEGFGSLDAETLDIAMTTLDELRQGGRTVGVISHVEAMREQLPAQVIVEAASSGASTIRQGVPAGV